MLPHPLVMALRPEIFPVFGALIIRVLDHRRIEAVLRWLEDRQSLRLRLAFKLVWARIPHVVLVLVLPDFLLFGPAIVVESCGVVRALFFGHFALFHALIKLTLSAFNTIGKLLSDAVVWTRANFITMLFLLRASIVEALPGFGAGVS